MGDGAVQKNAEAPNWSGGARENLPDRQQDLGGAGNCFVMSNWPGRWKTEPDQTRR